VRTNSVICRTNYKTVGELLQLCIDHQVDNINLIMFNPIIQATQPAVSRSLYVRHRDAGLEMIKAFDALGDSLPHTNVRYMPFCALPRYEHLITNHDQFNFEPDEWNNFARDCIKDGVIRATKRAVFALRDVQYKRFALRYGITGLLMAGMGRHYVKNQKIMSAKCEECAFVKVCDYVWKGYYEVFGDDVRPVRGEKIDNPVLITAAATIRSPGRLPAKRQESFGKSRFRHVRAEMRAGE
jgi:MoaA/NifB/PqqE/SkfB family radical SAM enzyme